MKRFLIVLSLAFAAAVMVSAACGKLPEDKPENGNENTDPGALRNDCVLSIMSFNVAVDNRQATTGWNARKRAVINMLSQVKPMVIGFQEAQAHEITDMVSAHSEYEWYGLGRESAKRPEYTESYSAEEAMVVFWLRDSLNAVNKGTFWLSEHPDQPGMGWDAAYPRTLTWVEFEHKTTGLRFFMFNTHLDNKGKTARSESMKLIALKMQELNPDKYPAFLTADFNTKSDDAIFVPINGSMKSTRDMAGDSDRDKNTYNGYSAPKSQIDHIFYKVTPAIKPLRFKVYDQNYGNDWISDHYPVMGTYSYTRITVSP